jgi:hypothetical protein
MTLAMFSLIISRPHIEDPGLCSFSSLIFSLPLSFVIELYVSMTNIYSRAYGVLHSCGLCRFEFSEGDEIISWNSCKDPWAFLPILTRNLTAYIYVTA